MRRLVEVGSLKIFLLFVGLLICIALSGCGGGGGSPSSTVDVSGTWTGTHTDSTGIASEFFLNIQQTDGTITGTISWSNSDNDASNFTGGISGRTLTLSSETLDGYTIGLAGTVSSDGATMSGTWTRDSTTAGAAGSWQASKNQSTAN